MITKDEIIALAKKVGFFNSQFRINDYSDVIYRFFQAAYEAGAAAEREACAKLCEELPALIEEYDALEVAAAAIRARSQQ